MPEAGTIVRKDIGIVTTGFTSVDNATGIGGYPRGRMTEIFGGSSAGKTALAMASCRTAANAGLLVVWIDLEHSLELKVHTDEPGLRDVLATAPATAEEAIDLAAAFLTDIPVDLLVLDSAIAMHPAGASRGLPINAARAELVGRALRKLTPLVARRNAVLLFLSRGYLMAAPEATASIGGSAPAYYASLRLKLTHEGLLRHEGEVDAYGVRVRVMKNKLAPPFKEAMLYYSFADGTLGEEPPLLVAEPDKGDSWR